MLHLPASCRPRIIWCRQGREVASIAPGQIYQGPAVAPPGSATVARPVLALAAIICGSSTSTLLLAVLERYLGRLLYYSNQSGIVAYSCYWMNDAIKIKAIYPALPQTALCKVIVALGAQGWVDGINKYPPSSRCWMHVWKEVGGGGGVC